jgi:branched-chain amino acid transport system permease protein
MTKLKLSVLVAAFALLALLPLFAAWIDEPFYVSLFARIMIFAIAAVSLDIILGYGGMISFGHAAYLGTGAYAVAIFSYYEIDNGWLQFPVAILASALVALVIGAICLRTSGIYFIMITLAFTQMLYFLGISLEEYGGDDGINTNRSEFVEWFDLNDDVNLYYLILVLLALSVYIGYRIINSRFGMVIRGSHSNDQRMQAIGYSTFRYKLTGFVIAGAMCGVAGFLLANLNEFLTPEYMNWFRSGEIMIMVLMGGMGTLFGPAFGAAAFILLEEWIPELLELLGEGWGANWWIVFGPVLIVLVLYAKQGLWGLIPGRGGDDG